MKVLVLVPPSRYARNVARDLLYGCWCGGKRIAGTQFPPISQAVVATVLKESGHQVNLIDSRASGISLQRLKEIVSKDGYKAVVVLTSTMTVNEDAYVLFELKKNADITTVCFGSHATFTPQAALQKTGVDIAVCREAEFIIRDLINALDKGSDYRQLKGICYRDDGKIALNEYYPFIENLDQLPFPDRNFLPKNVSYFNPVVKKMPFTTMFTSRGCPGKCVFCSSPSFYGNRIRFRSADSILEEMEIIEAQGYREIFFRDEIFTVNKKRTWAICEGILKRNLKTSWIASSRLDYIDFETMKIMKEAGCHMLRFGVESGSQEVLKAIRKDVSLKQTRQAFRWAHRIGIDTHAHLMIGMPQDTPATIETTIEFVKEIDPTVVTFGICTPYPGTELFERVKAVHPEVEDGSSCDLSGLHIKGFYNSVFCDIKPEELSGYVRMAYKKFYLRFPYILKWIKRIKSFEELGRVIRAGLYVIEFTLGGN